MGEGGGEDEGKGGGVGEGGCELARMGTMIHELQFNGVALSDFALGVIVGGAASAFAVWLVIFLALGLLRAKAVRP